jgi:antitoxin CptB
MDERRKQLRFRAWRRGFRELDLILGGFADAHFQALSGEDLDTFEALLSAPDQDVYAWIVGQAAPPPNYCSPLLARVQDFARGGLAHG